MIPEVITEALMQERYERFGLPGKDAMRMRLDSWLADAYDQVRDLPTHALYEQVIDRLGSDN